MFLKKIFRPLTSLSIRLRLSLIFVLIFGITTVLFNTFLFKMMIDTLQQDFDDALYNYAIDVSQGVDIGVKGDLSFPPLSVDQGKILPFPLGTALIQVRHSSGAVLARVGNFGDFDPPYHKDFEKIWHGDEATYRTIEHIKNIPEAEADSYRLISFPLDNAAKPQLLLQIAVPMTLLETQIAQRLRLLQIGIPFVLLVATLGGMFITSRALAPVRTIIDTTRKIKASELSERVPVPQPKDEIKTLALTLNDMLDRIQQAFMSQERFIADASHQLLTPLTIMKGELELFQKSDKQNVDSFIKSSLQEVDNLSGIVQEMLLLARVDAGISGLNMQNLSLDEVVFEALGRCEKIASNKNIKLKLNINKDSHLDRPFFLGDNDLLVNLVVNVVENAVKYSPRDSTVTVNLNWSKEYSELVVEDTGPGIPADQLAYIFDRFSRGSQMEARVKGFGLGLAIAQKIALLHNGQLSADNIAGSGAKFSFRIKNV